MNQIQDSYWAGLVDGEGCITISRRRKAGRESVYHQLVVQISMTDEKVMRVLHEQWGGTLALWDNNNPKWAPWYQWVLTSKKAFEFLIRIQPWLITKAEQAKVGIAFQKAMGPCGRNADGRISFLTKEQMDKREVLCAAIRVLNKRGPKARAEKLANSVDPATGNAVGNPEPSPNMVNA